MAKNQGIQYLLQKTLKVNHGVCKTILTTNAFDYKIGSCLAILTMGLCKAILKIRSKKFGVEE